MESITNLLNLKPMFKQLFSNQETLPSVIKDPFSNDCITDINIYYRKGVSRSQGVWDATVKFKNGDTQGQQNTPECKDFPSVMIALEQISKSLP
jgi:hypothetical protein